MSGRDLPADGTAQDGNLSFEEGVAALNDLVLDPDLEKEADPKPGENEASTRAEASEPEGAEPEGDAEAADQDEDLEAQGEDDEPEPYSGGRFAADDAKVTLADGTVVTVSELKRNNLFQADYSRKTMELAEERKRFESERSQIGQAAQSLQQQREFLLQAARNILPQPPDRAMMDADPFGYMQAKASYDERVQQLNALVHQHQAEQARWQGQTAQQMEQQRNQEAQRLVDAAPEFRDRKVYDQFWSDAVDVMGGYGFTAAELQGAMDHRIYLVMRDIVKYRKALKSAPKVAQDVQQKPVLRPGKRMDAKAKPLQDARARADRLRREGTIEAGAAALMDLID